MNVLVACEESQEVCIAFRNKGHNAFSCDIVNCSGGHPEWHIQCDVSSVLYAQYIDYPKCNSKVICFYTSDGNYQCIDKWDLLIGFPPCTFLTNAGACRMFHHGVLDEKRYLSLLAAREFFYKLWNCKISKICLENPTPMKLAALPKPSQIIQPWFFGHPYTKRTCLWLKNLPPLFSSDIVVPVTPFIDSNCSKNLKRGVAHNQVLRSKTFHGVALAMASSWG